MMYLYTANLTGHVPLPPPGTTRYMPRSHRDKETWYQTLEGVTRQYAALLHMATDCEIVVRAPLRRLPTLPRDRIIETVGPMLSAAIGRVTRHDVTAAVSIEADHVTPGAWSAWLTIAYNR